MLNLTRRFQFRNLISSEIRLVLSRRYMLNLDVEGSRFETLFHQRSVLWSQVHSVKSDVRFQDSKPDFIEIRLVLSQVHVKSDVYRFQIEKPFIRDHLMLSQYVSQTSDDEVPGFRNLISSSPSCIEPGYMLNPTSKVSDSETLFHQKIKCTVLHRYMLNLTSVLNSET
ncbi:hypothetical protein AVEN_207268-1 [Araneus ventricosus]|uniref:Uncharacterized protein n=1 Tax=Araneus ventricosus TaxID=182803 RepID=A0A4Y2ICI9_ARAVE|nr:hypothetical protein AVEN_207268-1 [Araneus ventricosus]